MAAERATPTGEGLGRIIQWTIDVSASMFIVILAIAAAFDPTIRLLHLLQALIYVAVMVLTHRRSAFGYGAGFVIAAFWNWINVVYTTFIREGFQQLIQLVQTGRLERPDLVIAVFAAAAHFALIAACVAGYFWMARNAPRAALKFWAGGASAVAYFVAIVLWTGPQYIPLLRRVVGLHH